MAFCVVGDSTTMVSLQKAAMLRARGSVLGLMNGCETSRSQNTAGDMSCTALLTTSVP